MSFSVILYDNKSRKNAVDKSLTTIRDNIEGTLKSECSIMSPDILLRIVDVSALNKCNYMYIEEFNRYYYVTDIISVRNNLVEVKGRVDVLMSFKDEIRNNSVILARYNTTSSYGNTYLQDDRMATYQDAFPCTYKFSRSFSKSDESFILSVAGG